MNIQEEERYILADQMICPLCRGVTLAVYLDLVKGKFEKPHMCQGHTAAELYAWEHSPNQTKDDK